MVEDALIVIASFADGYLEDLIKSIKENTTDVDYSIVVVDNHKDKEKLTELVEKPCKKYDIPYYFNTDIKGYGDALNTGVNISDSKSKYILYIDSDTKVSKGWLREMINCFERNKDKGCKLVGPLVKNFNNVYLPEMTNYVKDIKILEDNDFKLEHSYLVGVCYLRERETLSEFAWDKNFIRAYSEDADFTNQVRFWGGTVWVAGKALMYHKVNSSHETMRKEFVSPGAVGLANRQYLNFKWKTISDSKDKHSEIQLRLMTLGSAFTRMDV